MANIGYATLTIMPSMKGTQANLAKELGGLDSVGDKTGKSLGGRIGGALGKTLKVGVLAVGAAAGGALGTALFKGFGRLTKVEQATAKLTGLGHSAKSVQSIMDNALESVKGTAFGLDEAASTAAGAVASGVKPGQDLTRTLKLVGDAATIGGSSMSEMGSIFNKVAASGKLQGDVIAQLGDRGIPILQLLGEELGKTPAEVAKLASQGKIGFDEFRNAMENGLGGAALKSGDTFQGALANMQAALGRVGAKLLGGVFPQMKGVFGDLTAGLDGMGPAAEKIGAALGKAFAWGYEWVSKLVAVVSLFATGKFNADIRKKLGLEEDSAIVNTILTIRDAITGVFGLLAGNYTGGLRRAFGLEEDSEIVDKILNIRDTIMGVFKGGFGNINLGALGGLGAVIGVVAAKAGQLMPFIKGLVPHIGKLATVFRFMTGPVGIIIGLFATAYATSAEFRDAINGLLSVIGNLVGDLVSALLPVLTNLATTIMPIVANLFASLVPIVAQLITAIAPMIAQIAGALIPVLAQIISAVLPVFTTLLAAIIPVVLQLVRAVIPPLLGVLGAIAPLITTLLPVIGGLVTMLAKLLIPVIKALMPVVQIVFGVIAKVITAVMKVVQGIIKVVTSAIKGDWSGVWNGIKMIFSGVWDAIKAVVGLALKFIKTLLSAAWSAIKSVASAAWNGIRSVISGVWNGIKTAVSAAVNWVKSKIQAVWNGIKSVTSSVWNGIKTAIGNAIQGVVNTAGKVLAFRDKVIGAFTRLKDSAIDKVKALVDYVKGIPGKITSAIGNLGSTLYNKGRDLVQGLINGVSSLAGKIGSFFLDKVPGWIRTPFKKALGIASPSKVFAAYGENIGEGVLVGVGGMRPQLDRAMRGLVSVPSVPGFEGSVGAAGGRAGAGQLRLSDVDIRLLAHAMTQQRIEMDGREVSKQQGLQVQRAMVR